MVGTGNRLVTRAEIVWGSAVPPLAQDQSWLPAFGQPHAWPWLSQSGCTHTCAFFELSQGLAALAECFHSWARDCWDWGLERKPAPVGACDSSSQGPSRGWACHSVGLLLCLVSGLELRHSVRSAHVLVCKRFSADYFSSTLTTKEAKISSGEGKGRLLGNPSPWLEDGGGCFLGLGPSISEDVTRQLLSVHLRRGRGPCLPPRPEPVKTRG